ncbi:MAG: FtsX-like permease family protein [Planctomycetes bacterium]|nr:FtsX-like permease family protein [Planctomycetota bacterium]
MAVRRMRRTANNGWAMNGWTLIRKSLMHYGRSHAVVGLGVATATAVITGALLVGDSVRGSLRHMALDRLGRIEDVLLTDKFFGVALARRLNGSKEADGSTTQAVAAIVLPSASMEHAGASGMRRASGVLAIGCESDFWSLDARPVVGGIEHPGEGELFVNRPVADELGIREGDHVTLRLPDASQVPADSALGRKADRVRSLPRMKVARILDAEGLGRFSLRPHQGTARNVYIPLAALHDALDLGDTPRVNTILAGSDRPTADEETLEARHSERSKRLDPDLADLGLRVEEIRRVFPDPSPDGAPGETVFEYFSISTDRMILEPALSTALETALEPVRGQPVLSYLADSIRRLGGEGEAAGSRGLKPTLRMPRDGGADDADADGAVEIPYSIVTGIDASAEFPLVTDGAPLGPDDIVLNRWAADRLSARPGDRIRIEYFEPETAHGAYRMAAAEFALRAVVPLTEPASPYRRNRAAVYSERPGLFNDPDLTPEVKGITDQDSIESWEAPFPFRIARMKPIDDDYWTNHRTTPKAYVASATSRRLWGSRFGHATSFRVPRGADVTRESLERRIVDALRSQRIPAAVGFEFLAIKQESLRAARGTTPFDGLFLGLSFFLILASVMLVALLFQLGAERRVRHVGLLGAVGLPPSFATRALIAEGVLVAAIGGLFGIAMGFGYTALMLAGLRDPSWWRDAVGSSFLELHASSTSLAIGYASGVLACAAAIAWSARRWRRSPIRGLLAGNLSAPTSVHRRPRRARIVSAGIVCGAVMLAAAARRWTGEAQAGAFVGSGFLVLLGLLVEQRSGLLRPRDAKTIGLASFAMGSARRNAVRSLLTIGLMGSASFLIVAMSAFRVAPSWARVGGFRLVAKSSAPIFENLDDARTRADLWGERAAELEGVSVQSLRWKAGDDASCRNLYKVSRPDVLGVPHAFAERYRSDAAKRFPWSGAARDAEGREPENPWESLYAASDEPGVPVILDQNTALYALHWTGGVGSRQTVTYEDGTTVEFRIVGLLANTLLQGSLIVSEEAFTRLFPNVNGFRYFLIDAPEDRVDAARGLFEDRLGDEGFDVESTHDVLSALLAVQNTYLSTFQSLGALGLLLGTLGLAAAQARGVLERRGELALLRAAGFSNRRVASVVLIENVAILLRGLATGVLAAMCAVLPHMIWGDARVPIGGVLGLLLIVLGIGVVTAAGVARWALRGSLVASLRAD